MIRVLIADNSVTVRKRLTQALSEVPDFTVVGEAADGHAAVEMCSQLRPDVVLLDIVMPRASGVEATRQIMARCPTPILVVSGADNRGSLFDTYDALTAGAVDVLDKAIDAGDREWNSRLVTAVRLVSRIRVHRRVKSETTPSRAVRALRALPVESSCRVVVIGASTGGPSALGEVLSGLSATFAVPILVVLHIGRGFSSMFIEWLGARLSLPVRFAVDGEPLPTGPGPVIVAGPDRHLELTRGRLRLTRSPERHSCRPSVDVLFESVAREQGSHAIGCLLTGIGRDGAAGLLAMRQVGALTIAQDESTSVVFGMPREAIRLGAAQAVLPIGQIGGMIASRLQAEAPSK
jgi:two-component system chemotaxis response regulator CheB